MQEKKSSEQGPGRLPTNKIYSSLHEVNAVYFSCLLKDSLVLGTALDHSDYSISVGKTVFGVR